MKKKHEVLLVIDGLVNLILGILLILFPFGVAEILGVPGSDLDFYPTILGSIIFGIGIALLIERYGYRGNIRGLGLAGAIAINFCGATALLIWLLTGPLNLPLRGYIILWSIAVLVYAIGISELFAKAWKYE